MTVQTTLARMEAKAWGEYLDELRWLEALPTPDLPGRDRKSWLESMIDGCDPGHPLGVGMPMGSTLREDGESHRSAWMRIMRLDPCAYCSVASDTLDHIHPKTVSTNSLGGAHSWLNYAGACSRCNHSKSTAPLLSFLYMRRWGVRIHPKRR